MRRKAEHAGNDRAERELQLRKFFQLLRVRKHTRKPDAGKGDGIIEKELRGVDDPRILNDLQQSVHGARHCALFRAEHERVQHEGQERGDGHRAALRHMDGRDVGERKAHRNTYCGIGDGFGVKSALVASVEEDGADGDRGNKYRGADVEDNALRYADLDAVVGGSVARGEVDRKADEQGDECGGGKSSAYSGRQTERLFRKERGDIDRRDSQNDNGDAGDGRPEHEIEHVAIFIHIEKFEREHGGNDGNGESAGKAERGAHEVFHAFRLFEADEDSDDDENDDECDRGVQEYVHERILGKRSPHVGIVVVRNFVVAFACLKVVLIGGQRRS